MLSLERLYPEGFWYLGVVGAIVGQGDTYEEALSDVKSAIACYIEVFGKEMLEDTPSVEVFIAEAGVTV